MKSACGAHKKMKKKRFAQIRVDSWEGAVAIGKALAGHVFRGQLDSNWLLSTTLERAAGRYGFPDGALRNREVVLLNNFQRRAHHYLDDPPSLEDRLEWFALMQHHGAPTRLLDFSHSSTSQRFSPWRQRSKTPLSGR